MGWLIETGKERSLAYVITQNCCKDASCVPVCPVDCIRPADGQGGLADTEMLYIDPAACIDCGACVEECPVDAIHFEDEMPSEQQRFQDINARYFARHPLSMRALPSNTDHQPVQAGALRVAVVGAGPAGCYAVADLARIGGVEVNVFERLPTPFGLIRAGVAPDHQATKAVAETLGTALSSPQVDCFFNVAVGRDITHSELLMHHHAVIYAVGAPSARDLGVAGEGLSGSHSATEFVGWYNGHPDYSGRAFDMSGSRAVIIGNGNVALDVARVLLMPDDLLTKTDVADHAREALARNQISEVVIIGRRRPRDSAFSVGELLALSQLTGIDIIVAAADLDDLDGHPDDDIETTLKLEILNELSRRPTNVDNKRIVLRYSTSTVEFVGDTAVTALRVRAGDLGTTTELITTSLVVRSIGFQATPLPGLPFDDSAGIVPNDRGRVRTDGAPTGHTYVTGWVKRGPRGVIGTNRGCAEETVTQVWQDFDTGLLARELPAPTALHELLGDREVARVDWLDWVAIDEVEVREGRTQARPRAKVVAIEEMLAITRSRVPTATHAHA